MSAYDKETRTLDPVKVYEELIAKKDARIVELEALARAGIGTHGEVCTKGDGCQLMVMARAAFPLIVVTSPDPDSAKEGST